MLTFKKQKTTKNMKTCHSLFIVEKVKIYWDKQVRRETGYRSIYLTLLSAWDSIYSRFMHIPHYNHSKNMVHIITFKLTTAYMIQKLAI